MIEGVHPTGKGDTEKLALHRAKQQPMTSSRGMVEASPKASHAHQCATEMVEISPKGRSHAQQLLKVQPAPVFRNKLFIVSDEWNKLEAHLKELQNRMAAKTREQKVKGEVFIVWCELNLLAADEEDPTIALAAEIDELMQMIAKTEEQMRIIQKHIGQCDEVRKICATRGSYWVHDLNNLINNCSSKCWLKVLSSTDLSGIMKLHDLTGWLKDTSLFYCL